MLETMEKVPADGKSIGEIVCRGNTVMSGYLPHYMAPKTVLFEDLPKTSIGKVQKFILREKAKALGSIH